MKNFLSISLLIFFLLHSIFFSANSVSAQSNFSNISAKKILAKKGWKKIVSPSKKIVTPATSIAPKVLPVKKSVTSKTPSKQEKIIVVNNQVPTNTINKSIISLSTSPSLDKVVSDYVVPTKTMVVDIGSLRLELPVTIPKDINNKGDVVGYLMKTGSNNSYPFLFKNGKIKDIGGGYSGIAHAVNDNGQVAGQLLESYKPGMEGGVVRAFIWENGKITKIGKSPGIALDINNKKQVVGYQWIGQADGYPVHSFIWEKGVTKDLGTLGGDDNGGATTANAINDSGQVVGCSITKDGFQHPFLWENGKMKDLGNLYNEGGCAVDINNVGQVVGYFYKKDDNSENRIVETFLWEKGEFTVLTDAPKNFWPYKINNFGDVVGAYNGMTIRKNGVYSSYLELNGWSLNLSDGVGFNDNRQVTMSGNKAENNFKYGLIISLPDNMPEVKTKVQNIIKIEPVEEPRDPNTTYAVPAPATNF